MSADNDAPRRASLMPGRRLIVGSAEGTRMKGLRRIPKERRAAAVAEMLRRAAR